MIESISPAPMELLVPGRFLEQWMSEGPTGKWEINARGELLQKSLVGTRRGGSGTITALKNPVSTAISELRLASKPGTQHQSGIVFNLVDKNNFCVFCADRHKGKSDYFDLLAFSVTEGNYDIISKQRYQGQLPETAMFVLKQNESALALVFNDTTCYEWKGMHLFGKRIGLYSAKNDDAVFLSLCQVTVSPYPPGIPLQPPVTPEKTDAAEAVVLPSFETGIPAISTPEEGIRHFLNIRQPASKTEIEFTEVFTVPLDSFYSSLYQNSDIDNPEQSGLFAAAEVQLLDLRVKRWYRDLKTVREDLASARKDLEWKQKRIKQSEALLGKEMSDSDYAVNEKKLLERRSDARNILKRINYLRDQEGLLLREIRVNGYAVVENTTINAIIDHGYDFHLVGQAMARGEYDPVEFEADIDLADHNVWKGALNKLHQHLFDTQAITEKGATLYQNESEKLSHFSDHPALTAAEKNFVQDIEREEEIRPLYENAVRDLETEIADWESDKMILSQRKQFYNQMSNGAPYYTNSVHIKDFYERTVGWFGNVAIPVSTQMPYPSHPKFQADLLNNGKGHRMKLNRLIVDVYANSWEQSYDYYGDKRTAIYIFQCLAIHCAETDASFYHRLESSYTRLDYITGWGWTLNNPDWYYEGKLMAPNPDSRNEFGTTQDINLFFKAAAQICDHFIAKAQVKLESARQRVREIENKISAFRNGHADLMKNGLSRERRKFIEKWNDPATNLTAAVSTKVHYPDEDPLAEFLASISGNNEENAKAIETYFFSPTPDGFYNQNGLSLQEFMKNRNSGKPMQDVICVFPVFDSPGHISTEMVKAVKNPVSSTKIPSLPTIKFVESYRVEVGWLGYGLGELSHSFNLFPGETKELVIEKTTKLFTKVSETKSSEEDTSTHLTSSFEDNLQNEFSVGEKSAEESSFMNKNDSAQSASIEETSSLDFSASMSASGGIGIVSGKAEMGMKAGSSSKRNSAFSASQSAEQKRASNQSKDILSKNVSNAVRKVASETSQNNKLSFSAVSSHEYEESTSNREIIKLQNPNVGKTVNYNFFQVQNLFGVTTRLVDVQIVIDSGVEMAKGTGVNEVRVYDLEEFGKIFANSDGSERSAALSSIVARQVFKHYGDFFPGITSGNGSVTARDGVNMEKEMFEILNFSNEDNDSIIRDKIERIKTALHYLKKIPFIFREKMLSEEATVAVNCAAYHVESQLGFLPATETYLEDRREIETDKQRALVEQLREQTKAGIFFQELPAGVSSLTMDTKSHS